MSFIDKLKGLFGSRPQPAKEAPAADAPVQKPVSEAAAEDKTAAFEWIRDRILESVKNRGRLVAVLGALEPGSADPTFPPRYGRNWDYIDIRLRVVTGEIYADLSMDDGFQHEERPITPEQLHENRRRWGLDERYAHLKTEADWQQLLTNELRQEAAQSWEYAWQKKNRRNRTDAPPAAKPDPAPVAPTSAPVKVKRQKPPENLAGIRKAVINTVRARKTYDVTLCSWLWGEAAARFPGGPYSGWEYAGIELNVKTRELSVDLSRYPNQFGASEQRRESLTPERFQAKMKDWGVPELYWDMRTQEDWDELFDETLNEAIAELDRIKAKEAEAVRLRHCVVIPEAMYTARPAMKYTDIAMTLDQRYGATTVTVCQLGGAYRAQIGGRSYLGQSPSGKTVTLTAAEAVWLEDRVQRALQDGGSSTFSSLPGGDRMSVDIRQGSQLLESSNMTVPLNKYVQLLSSLEQLVQYGSICESETDRTPD